MKKHLLSGMAAILMSAALCACGGGKTAESTEAPAASAQAETTEAASTDGNTPSEETPVAGGCGKDIRGVAQKVYLGDFYGVEAILDRL